MNGDRYLFDTNAVIALLLGNIITDGKVKMQGRERFLIALANGKPDRLPEKRSGTGIPTPAKIPPL